eukprot:4707277-Ditylum_brightwellii.AAC.1
MERAQQEREVLHVIPPDVSSTSLYHTPEPIDHTLISTSNTSTLTPAQVSNITPQIDESVDLEETENDPPNHEDGYLPAKLPQPVGSSFLKPISE